MAQYLLLALKRSAADAIPPRSLSLAGQAAYPVASTRTLRLVIAGCTFELCGPGEDRNLAMLFDNFAALAGSARHTDSARPSARIEVRGTGEGYQLYVDGTQHAVNVSAAELIYDVEGILVPAVQLARPDLLFVHAACLSRGGRGCLLVGPSGAGKSTLCWALCQRGFTYLSDELAPLQRVGDKFVAHAYPHALCLKQIPPAPFNQSSAAFSGGRTWHLPIDDLADAPVTLSHIFHVSHQLDDEPQLAPLPLASAAQRIYTQVLNALAHSDKGLPASVALASSVHNVAVVSADLEASCRLVRRCFDAIAAA